MRKYIGLLILSVGLALLLYPLFTVGYGTLRQYNLRREFTRAQTEAEKGRRPRQAPSLTGPAFPTRLLVRKIDLDQIALEGTTGDVLAQGPGHYQETVEPGKVGLSAFAGHRVTFSHPFNRVDELVAGDTIIIERPNRARLVFVVTKLERVDPTTRLDLKSYKEPMLAFTTCDPKYSARYRLIVYARLRGDATARR